jgi:DNA-binding beta-propeller fold protein YncE
MPLRVARTIQIPDSAGSSFDHGAFDPTTRRVFVAHTGRDRVEVIDHDRGCHSATLEGFPHAAGVVADAGHVLVTNRGSASLAWLDADTLETRGVFDTAARPNGVALVAAPNLAIVACIGDETHRAELQTIDLRTRQRWAIGLPGRPRWCVTDSAGTRVFLAVRDPSMVLIAQLPALDAVHHWPLPVTGAHGIDIDHAGRRLYVACDEGALVEMDAVHGQVLNQWPLAGSPDATFFNPTSSVVHVAIEEPGLIQSIDPRTGFTTRLGTSSGAKTTALVPPDRLYVFSANHTGVLDLLEEP